jgi:hypothetical protein
VGAPGSFCENAGSAASGSEQKVRRFIARRVYFRRPARVKAINGVRVKWSVPMTPLPPG